MDKDNTSFTSEYRDFLEFIRQMQEAAREESYSILSEKKELEFKKRQQEYLLEDQEKQKIPNITMFSPLSSEDTLTNAVGKDELQQTLFELNSLEEKWQKQNEICSTFGKLKKFLLDVEGKIQQAEKAGKETKAVDTNLNTTEVATTLPNVTYSATISNDNSINYSAKL